MPNVKKVLLQKFFLIFFFPIAASLFGQRIRGTVVDGFENEPVSFASVLLYDSSGTKILNQKVGDLDGRFCFDSLKAGIYCLKIFSVENGDTLYRNVKTNNNASERFDIHNPCIYDRREKDKTCPVCGKKNKVIPIRYGLLIDLNGKKSKKDFYPGGCEVTNCDPHWYCKRDKKKF
jgi:hypothetical protein